MKTRLYTLLVSCLLAGCSHPVGDGDGNISPEPTIHANGITVTADVNRAVLDRPIMITTSCMPLITGKGVVGLAGRKRNGTFDWILLSPRFDTISIFQDPHYTIYIPAEFTANQEFVQNWEVQLQQRTGPAGGSYYFDAGIHVDSIFISDSNRFYGIYSDVARKYCPRPLGWQPDAVGDGFNLNP